METAASSVATTRGGSLQNPSPTAPSRKEWRAVSDSQDTTDYVVTFILLGYVYVQRNV